jgi:DNA-binding response OmpR family regulator
MSYRILIADDEPALRTVLTLTLKTEGLVEAASDGEEALERIRDGFAPDLVIVDNNMPRKGGIEVIRELRADSQYDGVALVLLTAEDDDKTRSRATAAGADAVLQKPMRGADLRVRVREIIEAKKAQI